MMNDKENNYDKEDIIDNKENITEYEENDEVQKLCEKIDEEYNLNERLDLEEERKKINDQVKKINFKQLIIKRQEDNLSIREKNLEDEYENLKKERENFLEEKKQIRKEYEEYANETIKDIKERNIELSNKLNIFLNIENENGNLKYKIENYESQIKFLKEEIVDLQKQVEDYKTYKELSEIDNLKQKLENIQELENENQKLKNENKSLHDFNKILNEKENEIDTLKDMNEILKSRLDRSTSNIRYLKSIEKSKGIGVDSSQEQFEEIITLQKEKDERQTSSRYISDEKFVDGFIDYCKEAGFIYNKNLVRTFLASIKSSRLTILKGYSGTGKSSLPILIAKYLKAECEVVAVEPNWRTKQDIIGFYNYFTNKFIPTELTKTLIRANVSKDRIFLVVLDEMNLARVEYYFSEFNSKLWADKEKRKIKLFEGMANYNGCVQDYIHNNEVSIPDNIFFIGTINEDDSVSPISDKIFDRAQVVDFMELPSSNFRGNLDDLYEIDDNKYTKYSSFMKNKVDGDKNIQRDMDIVNDINKSIKEKFGKVIGYRSLNQINQFIYNFNSSGGKNIDALDIQLVSKFVPKFSQVYSEEQIMLLEELKEEIKLQFMEKLGCSESDASELQIIKKIDSIIRECSE